MELGCIVKSYWGVSRGEVLPNEVYKWEGDYIFSYRCYWLLPIKVINKPKLMALNFHFGTPSHPGSGSYSWAIYNSSKEFGITLHLMNEKYDAGKIIEVYKFKISDFMMVEDLIDYTYEFSIECFKKVLDKLDQYSNLEILKIKKLKTKYKWKGEAKKISDINKMRKIDKNIDEHELKKRIRAFHFKDYPLNLSIHGKEFQLVLNKKLLKKIISLNN